MADDTNQPAATSSGPNKKILYIIGGIIVVALVGGFIFRATGFMAMRAAGVNVVPGPGGAATYTASDGQGTVTVGGNKMPDNWPSDAPQPYSGATIQYSGSSNPTTGKAGAAIVYSTKASAADVINYYKTQLTSQGWTVAATANMGANSVLSAKKDTRNFGVSVIDSGTGLVQVTAGLDL